MNTHKTTAPAAADPKASRPNYSLFLSTDQRDEPSIKATLGLFLRKTQELLNTFGGTRTDHFLQEPHSFEHIIYKLYPYRLFHLGELIHKLHLIFAHIQNTNQSRYHDFDFNNEIDSDYCCIEIDTETQKIIYSLSSDDMKQLTSYLDICVQIGDITRYIDHVLMRTFTGPMGNRYWSFPYGNSIGKMYCIIHEAIIEEVITTLKKQSITSIALLEYGCGHGNLLAKTVIACRKNGIVVNIAIGTDANVESIDEANKKVLSKEYPSELKFYQSEHKDLVSTLSAQWKVTASDIKNSATIALSSGATNRKVLTSADDAISILKTLRELSVDYVFLSGATECLVNNAIAKRSGFILTQFTEVNYKGFEPVLILKKQSPEQVKKYQHKFPQHRNYYAIKNEYTAAMTQNFFNRLFFGIPVQHYFEHMKEYEEFLILLEIALTLFVPKNKKHLVVEYEKKLHDFNKKYSIHRLFTPENDVNQFAEDIYNLFIEDCYPAAITLIQIYQHGIPIFLTTSSGEYYLTEHKQNHIKPWYIAQMLCEFGFISIDMFFKFISFFIKHVEYTNREKHFLNAGARENVRKFISPFRQMSYNREQLALQYEKAHMQFKHLERYKDHLQYACEILKMVNKSSPNIVKSSEDYWVIIRCIYRFKENSPPEIATTDATLYAGKLDEAWHYNQLNFPMLLAPIVTGYLGGDIDANSKRYSDAHRSQFMLFHFPLRELSLARASEAAILFLSDDVIGAERLIALNPSILDCNVPVVIDPIRREIMLQATIHLNQSKTTTNEKSALPLSKTAIHTSKTLLQIITDATTSTPTTRTMPWKEASARKPFLYK